MRMSARVGRGVDRRHIRDRLHPRHYGRAAAEPSPAPDAYTVVTVIDGDTLDDVLGQQLAADIETALR